MSNRLVRTEGGLIVSAEAAASVAPARKEATVAASDWKKFRAFFKWARENTLALHVRCTSCGTFVEMAERDREGNSAPEHVLRCKCTDRSVRRI